MNTPLPPLQDSLHLPPTLRPRCPTLDLLRLGPIYMMRRDPTLIVGLCTRGNRRSIRAQHADLI